MLWRFKTTQGVSEESIHIEYLLSNFYYWKASQRPFEDSKVQVYGKEASLKNIKCFDDLQIRWKDIQGGYFLLKHPQDVTVQMKIDIF